jgi:hypothetical protein
VDFNPSRQPLLRGATLQRLRSDLSTNSSTRQRWRQICEVANFYDASIVLFFPSSYQSDCLLVSYMNNAGDGFLWEAATRCAVALAHSDTMICAVGTHRVALMVSSFAHATFGPNEIKSSDGYR